MLRKTVYQRALVGRYDAILQADSTIVLRVRILFEHKQFGMHIRGAFEIRLIEAMFRTVT